MATKWKVHPVLEVPSDNMSESVEKKLISHVPDLVVFDKNPGKIPHVHKFDGVLLFADVSGFTALTERYTQSSEKGTDALTVTLNAYIGKIVQNILQLGGDILKFAGDAILAVWKVTERKYLAYAISQAARCSLTIQEKCDNQLTDVGVKLRVKIAISAGKIYSTFVGNEKCSYFVMAGRPVGEVNAAEKYCAAGLVVLSPNALELSERDNIIFDPLPGRFGMVRYLRHDPRKDWHEYVDLPDISRLSSAKGVARIALRLFPKASREATIRKYITGVVQRKLDDDQPLKFLSEMRQCSIAFINMAFDLNERDRHFHEKQCQNMQQAFDTVYNCATDMQGSLNKIFMFDKGCTFLVIFGLPGDKHEQEPANALQASWKITQELTQIPTLTYVSIGVTTGPVFCGVIGHEERHEYTVIGQKVNLAARLMMHYPSMVSCDSETFQDSKLSKDMFTRLPDKAMKGCGEVIVHGYKEGQRKPIGKTVLYEPEYPIIGREEEVSIFMEELCKLKDNQSLGSQRRVIVLEGEAGYGKTRVMEEIQWRASLEKVRVVAFPLSINDANCPFFTLKTLIELLLGVQSYNDSSIREKALLCATDPSNQHLLSVLNDIIAVDFPQSEQVAAMSSGDRTREMHRLVVQIVHRVIGSRFVLFALDDAQNVDNDSWNFLTTLSKDSRALCVLGMRPFSPDKPPCEAAKQVLGHPKTMYVKLGGLPNEYMGALVCQLLKVQRIPSELERAIAARSHGVPRWCEQLVQEMQNSGLILLVPISRSRPLAQQSYALTDITLITRNGDRAAIGQPDIPFHEQEQRKKEDNAVPTSSPVDPAEVLDNVESRKANDADAEGGDKSPPEARSPDGQRKDEFTENIQDGEERTVLTKEKADQTSQRPPSKGILTSWADRIPFRKSSTGLIEFLRGSKTKMTQYSDDDLPTPKREIAMELVIKPGFNVSKFPVPASIRGMALARLDRMKPYEQLIVKCAAVIGENFSRKMLSSVVPGFQEDKFQRSILQLMRLRVFHCASAARLADHAEESKKSLGQASHQITCSCHVVGHEEEGNSGDNALSEEDLAAKCQQLMFINSLVQEIAYSLWLEDQRKSLHESCACYLENKIDELLITGTNDEEITKQFRICQKFSLQTLASEMTSRSSVILPENDATLKRQLSWRFSGIVPSDISALSVKNNISGTSFMSRKSVGRKAKKEPEAETQAPQEFAENVLAPPEQQNRNRRISSSVIGRMNVERVGAYKVEKRPLRLTHDSFPEDYVSSEDADEVAVYMAQARSLNVDVNRLDDTSVHPTDPSSTAPTSDPRRGSRGARRGLSSDNEVNESGSRRMSYSPLWSQSVGLSTSYERILVSTEKEAKRLAGFQLEKVMHTPYELHYVFALLHPHLACHWRKAGNTRKTIEYLLKAGESSIATLLLGDALRYLEEANEILQNLAKGNDIVAKVNEDDDDGGIEDVKVLSVSRETKAKVQNLLGQVYYQQGKLELALTHFLKTLKIMRCSVPRNPLFIALRMWYETRKQNLHMKKPNKYIGSADSKLANKYIEQVRCLSYVWQVLLNLKRVPNRIKLAKLVAVMQVNRAEAADDDLQELITAYTYMMQLHQLTGDLGQSAYYENKATLRCLELPRKLTAADLYITGHLHLVSCCVRICNGKLTHATTSGYRAYNVSDTLHDASIKLIVLPLLAQIHILAGRGRACIEVLNLLKHISLQENDDAGMTSYYCACMDLLLDSGFAYESYSACVDYMQSSESINIGDVPRLYVRSSMAVCCFRCNEVNKGKAWLSQSDQVIPEFFDNFHSVRAYTRVVEAHLIAYKKNFESNGQKDKETVAEERTCRRHLSRLSGLCKQFPVFQPRLMLLQAYFFLLTGQQSKAREKVSAAANMARYCGNAIDRKWAQYSQNLWFSPSSLTSEDIDFWEENYRRLPDWTIAACDEHINRQYSLKMAVSRF